MYTFLYLGHLIIFAWCAFLLHFLKYNICILMDLRISDENAPASAPNFVNCGYNF